MKLLQLITANYGTYTNSSNGTNERHWIRISLSLTVSILLAIFSNDASDAYPIMVTGITILTGFTFTALFSNHVLADVGLPRAKTESDRTDLKRLGALSKNFKTRSKYFISLSIFEAVLLIAASLQFAVPKLVSASVGNLVTFIDIKFGLDLSNFCELLIQSFSEAFFVVVTFIFLECVYTFYRLTETIVTIVDTRSDYMKAAEVCD